MNIQQHTSPNINRGRQGWIPDIIVCHITEGAFNGAVSWLINPQSQVSSHFVVAQDGRVAQLVPLTDTAWANGTTTGTDNRGNRHSRITAVRDRNVNANLYTISIEHEGRLTETGGRLTPAQLEATLWLVAHIRSEVKRIFNKEIPINRDNIVGHADITPRWKPNCPGAGFQFDEIIQRLRTNESPSITENTPNPSRWAREAWDWAVQHRLTDGTNPQGIPTREQMMQLLYNYDQFISSNSRSQASADASLGI